jgi:hypothetical protein
MGLLKNIVFFCEGPIKMAHDEKMINFGMHPQIVNMDCK